MQNISAGCAAVSLGLAVLAQALGAVGDPAAASTDVARAALVSSPEARAGRARASFAPLPTEIFVADADGSHPTPFEEGTPGWLRAPQERTRAPETPRADVLKGICASPFGQGRLARVEMFRNALGAVVVLALRPDITRFTHAPHTYYGPDGTSLLVVPDRPVTREEMNSDPLLRKQADLLRGLKEAGSASCEEHR